MDFSSDWLLYLDMLIDWDWVNKNPPDDPPDWDFDEQPFLFEEVFGFPVEVFEYA